MKNDHVDTILEQWRNERPDIDPSPMGVIGRLVRVTKLFSGEIQNVYAEFGLNVGEFDVLATLRRSGTPYALTPNQLLQTLMLTSGAMTNRIDKLELKKLVQRSKVANDRRGVLISLTPKGLELINEAVTKHVSNEKDLLDSLSSKEQESLAQLLKQVLLKYEN